MVYRNALPETVGLSFLSLPSLGFKFFYITYRRQVSPRGGPPAAELVSGCALPLQTPSKKGDDYEKKTTRTEIQIIAR